MGYDWRQRSKRNHRFSIELKPKKTRTKSFLGIPFFFSGKNRTAKKWKKNQERNAENGYTASSIWKNMLHIEQFKQSRPLCFEKIQINEKIFPIMVHLSEYTNICGNIRFVSNMNNFKIIPECQYWNSSTYHCGKKWLPNWLTFFSAMCREYIQQRLKIRFRQTFPQGFIFKKYIQENFQRFLIDN